MSDVMKMVQHIQKLKDEEIMRIALEALEFYASETNNMGIHYTDVIDDDGERAREALTRIRELVGKSEDGE